MAVQRNDLMTLNDAEGIVTAKRSDGRDRGQVTMNDSEA